MKVVSIGTSPNTTQRKQTMHEALVLLEDAKTVAATQFIPDESIPVIALLLFAIKNTAKTTI